MRADRGAAQRLHLEAVNNGPQAVQLPAFGSFTALDDADTTYKAVTPGSWQGNAPAGGKTTGVIEPLPALNGQATTLTVSFTAIYGPTAPQGGISVKNIRPV